jgi:hypothetical protein
MGDEMLFGELENGGKVVVDVAEDKLTFKFVPEKPASVKPESDKPEADKPASATDEPQA